MPVEFVKKRWVYANKECTLNTAITVHVLGTGKPMHFLAKMVSTSKTIIDDVLQQLITFYMSPLHSISNWFTMFIL